MDYRYIATALQQEHPQTMALALSRMPAEHAAEVIRLLPMVIQVDMLGRISRLGDVPEDLLEPVDALITTLLG